MKEQRGTNLVNQFPKQLALVLIFSLNSSN